MRSLPRPTDRSGKPYAPVKVFDLCIRNVEDPDLLARLKSIRLCVQRAAALYDAACARTKLYRLKPHTHVGKVTGAELAGVYTDRMAKRKRPGRPIYNRIIAVPEHGRCPLCNLGPANTLDHHLPKSKYPVFAVTPNNLVPSCQRCQGVKKQAYPTCAEEQTLHPYFDNFEGTVWLYAEVVQSTPAVFRFSVAPPSGWSKVDVKRLRFHVKALKLNKLYAENAGSELAGMRGRLSRLLAAGGRQAVREHLLEEARSWAEDSKNSWKAAMLTAAAASDWFCDGGFGPH